MEDPGYTDPREQVRRAGARVHPVRVDEQGLRVDDLARLDHVGAVVVTPAHQYPTGVVLSAERRTALAQWAQRHDAYVVEDDYDAEYRYDRQPIGAVQGVAPDRVVYSGTLSKSLAPGLRLGWLVVPPDLVGAVADARALDDRMAATLVEAPFVQFLERGDLDRHLRRSRRVYRERRDALIEALARRLPEVKVGGISAGLTALVTLPPGWDSGDVKARAEQHGVGVYLIDDCADPAFVASSLLLGYGTLRPTQIEQGVRHLAEALTDLTG
jgi:GntR family transcriptional regulator / MocR family aminotransferase